MIPYNTIRRFKWGLSWQRGRNAWPKTPALLLKVMVAFIQWCGHAFSIPLGGILLVEPMPVNQHQGSPGTVLVDSFIPIVGHYLL